MISNCFIYSSGDKNLALLKYLFWLTGGVYFCKGCFSNNNNNNTLRACPRSENKDGDIGVLAIMLLTMPND